MIVSYSAAFVGRTNGFRICLELRGRWVFAMFVREHHEILPSLSIILELAEGRSTESWAPRQTSDALVDQ